MTSRSGLLALSAFCIGVLVMMVVPEVEAYKWVDISVPAAVVLVASAVLGFLARAMSSVALAVLAGAVALVAAEIQLVSLTDGGMLGGNGSTFALLLGVGIGFLGLAVALRFEVSK